MTLYPGDVICTGTPPGVGMGHKPSPIYLRDGDVMTLGISGLGEQRQPVTARNRPTNILSMPTASLEDETFIVRCTKRFARARERT